MREFFDHYVRGLGMSARNNALAYGYSVTITASYGIINHVTGKASVAHIFAFLVGASVPFAAINALVTRGFRERVEREPPVVVALATSFGVLSISVGVGAAAGLASALDGWLSWLVGALAATVVYLAVSALEMALARGLHGVAGTEEVEER